MALVAETCDKQPIKPSSLFSGIYVECLRNLSQLWKRVWDSKEVKGLRIRAELAVECPGLGGEKTPVGKCRACKFHHGVKSGNVVCDFP